MFCDRPLWCGWGQREGNMALSNCQAEVVQFLGSPGPKEDGVDKNCPEPSWP